MRPDSYIKEEAEAIVKNATPQYLILGFEPDGIRGIPAKYKLIFEVAQSDEELYIIASSIRYPIRVFELDELDASYIEKEVAQRKSEKTEKQERELLQKLKDKYENK